MSTYADLWAGRPLDDRLQGASPRDDELWKPRQPGAPGGDVVLALDRWLKHVVDDAELQAWQDTAPAGRRRVRPPEPVVRKCCAIGHGGTEACSVRDAGGGAGGCAPGARRLAEHRRCRGCGGEGGEGGGGGEGADGGGGGDGGGYRRPAYAHSAVPRAWASAFRHGKEERQSGG